jgi:hypothetical protein
MAESSVKRPTGPHIAGNTQSLPLKIYGLMATVSVLTFATLTTGYQLFFSSSPFA